MKRISFGNREPTLRQASALARGPKDKDRIPIPSLRHMVLCEVIVCRIIGT